MTKTVNSENYTELLKNNKIRLSALGFDILYKLNQTKDDESRVHGLTTLALIDLYNKFITQTETNKIIYQCEKSIDF